jgi:hypothetical protein
MDQIIQLILSSQLFDADWYLRRYPDVHEAGIDPLEHYLRWGAAEGRNPNSLFDSEWYLQQYPDACESGMSPLEHYLRVGVKAGCNPNPLFDSNWYVEQYPDVIKAGMDPLQHYLHIGASSACNPHPLFDSDWYLKRYPDIADGVMNPLEHYLWWGGAEGRDPNPMFDGVWYLQRNPEVADSGINPLIHYLYWGASEGCDPNAIFDSDWYLQQNPDVAESGVNPLVHFLTKGRAEGRTANPWMQSVSTRISESTKTAPFQNRKIYVYTALLAGYDELPTIAQADPRIEFVAFTDMEIAPSQPWSIVPVDDIFSDRKISSGFLKTNPELLFEQDSIVVWIDGNLRDLRIDCEAVLSWLSRSPVAAPPHLIREKIEAEKILMEYLSVEDRICANRLWQHICDLGFKDDQGLSATLFLARDLRDPRVRVMDRVWWDSILNGARRDQLSFNYAVWAAGLTCQSIEIDWRYVNPVFSVVEHKHTNGRTVEQKPFDLESTERVAWRGLNKPDLPINYPSLTLFHPEQWSAYAIETIRLLNRAVVESGEILEGNYCYFDRRPVHPRTPPDPRRSWKREVLRRAVIAGERALELGFNAGHSALVMLDANPCLKLTSIDIALHQYTRRCAEIISTRYPGRFNVLFGSSRNVLTGLATDNQFDFQIVHLDAGHSAKDFLFDLEYVLRHCSTGCTIVVDDAYIADINDLISMALQEKYLKVANISLPVTGENRVFVRTDRAFVGTLQKLARAVVSPR